MEEARFERAAPKDLDDVIDFGDLVFSKAHLPHDFMSLLPKLYSREYFMDGIHYLAREGGKIRALVGAYPLKFEFSGEKPLPGRGIGMVSVHPRFRSKGYMKVLMNMALEDMKKDGMIWSCLGGQRQRYEYFGYTPAGSACLFTVRESNIRHTLGRDWKTDLSLKTVKADDKLILDSIQALHEAKNARLYRNRDRLFDILSSWNAQVFALTQGERFEGYMVCRPGSWDIEEINLECPSRVGEALGLLLHKRKDSDGQDSVQVAAGPHETEKITILSEFAETYCQTSVYHFNILDFKSFVEPFLKLKARERVLAEGSFVLRIEGPSGGNFLLTSKNGKAGIGETAAPPDLILDPLKAARFFFSPESAIVNPAIRERAFLQSLLPLPLFFESPDGI